MFVRWKRRKLKRDDQPVFTNPDTGEEVEPNQGMGEGRYDVHSPDHGRRTYVRNISWRRSARAKGFDPDHILTKPAPDAYALDAVLVESRRIDGKPRQRHIAHIASIREVDLEPGAKPQWRIAFWKRVDAKLSELDLTIDQVKRVRESIAQKVPLPTDDESETYRQEEIRTAMMIRNLNR